MASRPHRPMYMLPAELALLVSVLISSPPPATASPAAAPPHVSPRDAMLPCTGQLAPFNVDGQSPGSIYLQLQTPCNTLNNMNASICRCNLVAYNLNMASTLCQNNALVSWPQWASSNLCPSSSSSSSSAPVLLEVPYDTGSLPIPKWAHTALTTTGAGGGGTAAQQFDMGAALKQAKGWSIVQIVVPVVVGVGVAVLALVLFLLYRARKKDALLSGAGSGSRARVKGQRAAWRDARLQGPRRFFGLIPDVLRVRERRVREPLWEIDGGLVAVGGVGGNGNGVGGDASPSPPGSASDSTPTHTHTHERAQSSASASMHSRTTSITSLLPSLPPSSPFPSPRGLFAWLSTWSLTKNYDYEIGTSKGKDYKRVAVRTASLGEREREGWGIDVGGGTGSGSAGEGEVGGERERRESITHTHTHETVPPSSSLSLTQQNLAQNQTHTTPGGPPSSLPSVLDIRGPGPARSQYASTRTYTRGETVDSEVYVPEEDLWTEGEIMSPGAAFGYGEDGGGGGGAPSAWGGGSGRGRWRTGTGTGAQSDYSLATADLQTPITPSRDAAAAFGFLPRPNLGLPTPGISPGSPFLPSSSSPSSSSRQNKKPRSTPTPTPPPVPPLPANINVHVRSQQQALAPGRNKSTDTMAYELYPRTAA